MHFELAECLSTFDFIIARRNRPSVLYSDNGTSFIGVNKELIVRLFNTRTTQSLIAMEGVEWKFNAPHIGRLWEANIKSMKRHLYKIIGPRTLDYLELNTLIIKIEACMNSRPSCADFSNASSDLTVLTRDNFLTGRSLASLPLGEAERLPPLTVARRWMLVQIFLQSFWKL